MWDHFLSIKKVYMCIYTYICICKIIWKNICQRNFLSYKKKSWDYRWSSFSFLSFYVLSEFYMYFFSNQKIIFLKRLSERVVPQFGMSILRNSQMGCQKAKIRFWKGLSCDSGSPFLTPGCLSALTHPFQHSTNGRDNAPTFYQWSWQRFTLTPLGRVRRYFFPAPITPMSLIIVLSQVRLKLWADVFLFISFFSVSNIYSDYLSTHLAIYLLMSCLVPERI